MDGVRRIAFTLLPLITLIRRALRVISASPMTLSLPSLTHFPSVAHSKQVEASKGGYGYQNQKKSAKSKIFKKSYVQPKPSKKFSR
jgi:hypothetical protein